MTTTAHPCSGVILAGGLNSRMDGRNKAFLKIGGETILERILRIYGDFFDDILVVTRQPELYPDTFEGHAVRVVTDIYDARSSLTGIHAGLFHARCPFAFVAACDAPFIRPELVRFLTDAIEPALDVIVPEYDGHYEPLCAIYSKRCLPLIESQLERRDFKIFNFFDEIELKTISQATILRIDPEMVSFFNVNTPEAYQKSKVTAARRGD